MDHFVLVRPEYSRPALKVIHCDRSGLFGRSDQNVAFHLPKLLGHFSVFLSPQCWCARFGDWTAINNFERDKACTRRKKNSVWSKLVFQLFSSQTVSAGLIDVKWETLYLLVCRLISWNNLLLPMEQMFYFCEYVTSLWLLWNSEILWLTS